MVSGFNFLVPILSGKKMCLRKNHDYVAIVNTMMHGYDFGSTVKDHEADFEHVSQRSNKLVVYTILE